MRLGAKLLKTTLATITVFALPFSGGVVSAYGQATSNQRPNIVMLMTDDTGWAQSVRCTTSRWIPTRNTT